MATPRKPRRTSASTRRRSSLSGLAGEGHRPMRPVALGIIAATLLGGGYLLKKGIDKVVGSGSNDDFALPSPTGGSKASPAKKTTTKPTSAYTTNAGSFPLKHGQKGELIRTLQTSILAKGGPAAAEIRTSGGADGSFGDGLARALAALGEYSSRAVDQAAFNRILGLTAALPAGTSPAVPTPGTPAAVMSVRPLTLVNAPDPSGKNMMLPEVAALRTQLEQAVERYDPTAAALAVAAARNVAGYKALNYNTYGIRWSRAGIDVRQTIATKLSQMFAGSAQVRTALLSIGLTIDAAGIWHADF